MNERIINYETFIKITNAISHSKEPEEIALMTVEGIKTALNIKGCALFLLNHKTNELEVAASFGLSRPDIVVVACHPSLQKSPVCVRCLTVALY